MWDNRDMKPINLTKTLKPYTSGWVAVNKKNKQVIAHSNSFKEISKKIKEAKDILLIPASDKYFGFITRANA